MNSVVESCNLSEEGVAVLYGNGVIQKSQYKLLMRAQRVLCLLWLVPESRLGIMTLTNISISTIENDIN